ncbi:MAG: LarC family nickel insertion protein [Thermoleophilia bacterium]|nr:LarC family nickel insertion protein [Thermoleophilia bacterium]
MRVAYLDPCSGVSGDLLLGALVDVGVSVAVLQAAVDTLGVEGLRLSAATVLRHGVTATKVDVSYPDQHEHRRLSDIAAMIEAGGLPDGVRRRAIAVFTRLAEAEAAVHEVAVDEVRFHEVGAADALADVVGAVAGLDALAVARLLVGPVNLGSGRVTCAHGTLPVPAPATAGLLEGWSCYVAGPRRELTTPTGAALVTTLGDQVAVMPALRVERAGHGAADGDPPGWANVLRLVIGETEAPPPGTS